MSKADTNKPVLKNDSVIGIINRGESALRFIRALKEYNEKHGTKMKSVAFYIDVEKDAYFVQEADKAIALSSVTDMPQTGSMYLDKDLMVKALVSSGCNGVWVGWGFVSEDAAFAKMVEDEGFVFLGPDSKAMSTLGDKIAAKELAGKADVPILPWSKGAIRSLDEAREFADTIGYPVIIKASNAGGGRGIRFVHAPDQLESQYESARDETRRITGNDIVFMEYLVTTCRHLEVQTMTDRYSNVLTFGVRDCSVQRRNQKIIEETPPPNLPESLVTEMEAASARLIKKAGYESAGTVEYLYDVDTGKFYFMEVNTRLQVEHPITELVYSFDLVKGQIDVAFGKSFEGESYTPSGCAMELRLNAEDPDREFTPSPGKVSVFEIPAGSGIRVDSGIRPGNTIPSEFDSMVAKIIAYGCDRREIMARLSRALREMKLKIENGTTNRALLLELLHNPDIVKGGVNTAFVGNLIKENTSLISRDKWDVAIIAGAVAQAVQLDLIELENFKNQLLSIGHPRMLPKSKGHEISIGAQGNTYELFIRETGANSFQVEVDGGLIPLEYEEYDHEGRLHLNGESCHIQMVDRGDAMQCEVDGMPYPLEMGDSGFVAAPSPAVVLSIAVKKGQQVAKGEMLLSLEAMKMEMLVNAPQSGIVSEICVIPGTQVAAGQPLALIEAEEEEAEEGIAGEPVDFSSFIDETPKSRWNNLRDQYEGIFLGYDLLLNAPEVLDELIQTARHTADNKQPLEELIIRSVEAFLAVENLFMRNSIFVESFSREATFKELLYHFFRRTSEKTKGLPDVFVQALERVTKLYNVHDLEEMEDLNHAVSHMYKSRSISNVKADLVKKQLLYLESTGISPKNAAVISDLLDELADKTADEFPALADAAVHARYMLVDEVKIKKNRKEQIKKLVTILEKNIEQSSAAGSHHSIADEIIESGPEMINELILLYKKGGEQRRKVVLDLIAQRLGRDREIASGEYCLVNDVPVYKTKYKDTSQPETIYAVSETLEKASLYAGNLAACGKKQKAEIILLVANDTLENTIETNNSILPEVFDCEYFSIGQFSENYSEYYSYKPEGGTWTEIRKMRYLCPSLYRELRVERLQSFDLTLVYRSEIVFIYSGVSKENSRDERLFALVSANEVNPELDDENAIQRLVGFEHAFMEAVNELRLLQSKRKRRLFWNRIIIHNRTFMKSNLMQIRDYGMKLIARVKDLGIENVNVYTRRKKFNEEKVKELELVFHNFSGNQFSLRSRKPANDPLESMNKYVSNVVRARQRNTIYPYELLKLITFSGFPFSTSFPRGEFEEFDIEIDAKGGQKYVSVKNRKYGSNDGNIVFGIIENHTNIFPRSFRRVIILSDSTLDMGTLAEKECRRVNAALDLAEAEGLPVEWLPISSGARIDMNSGTENLDWTAATLRRIIEFTQNGGEINIIVSGINVGAQSYWNAEATMLMHTSGLLIMTDTGTMLLTGKKALDFAGSVSAEDNFGIGGVERVMGPNGQAQIHVKDLTGAYKVLFDHYTYTYKTRNDTLPAVLETNDPVKRDIGEFEYNDTLGQGFNKIGDIFSKQFNPERKKPFDMRQLMQSIIDRDLGYLERWKIMKDAETAIVWETRVGGHAVGMIGIESKPVSRLGEIPYDGPEAWNGGTLFPLSSKKVARGINAFSGKVPLVMVANLSGFDGSPESLRQLQLEYGAEIGRAIVNFVGPVCFIVVARYHGGAYVVFSKALNTNIKAAALEGSYASVIGGAPAAAVVFPRKVREKTYADKRIIEAQDKLSRNPGFTKKDFDDLYQKVYNEYQTETGQEFDSIHSVERAKKAGSIDEIITTKEVRPYIVSTIRGYLSM